MRNWLGVITSVMVITLSMSSNAWALREPKPLPSDSRIQTILYSPNEIFKFTGHYGFESSIEFENDEEIKTISLGDSVSWQITPSGSRLFLKPIEQDALTNMTVVTSKRTYHFELHASKTDNIRAAGMVFVLRFEYPESETDGGVFGGLDAVPLPDVEDHPEKYNFKYSVSGSDVISPIRIFDDGEFTYFQFRDKNADVPAFFLVTGTGDESMINFRTRGDYIVVERVTSQFTLRHGTDVACVFNEARPLKRIAEKHFWQ